MIKVTNYIVKRLAEHGIRHAFMVTGGGAMHLNDSLGCEQCIQCIFNQHEQASAIAAEGYYRASDRLAVVNVTSGPGGTNTMTGVIGQWLDSIPALYLSGQVKQQTTIASCPELGLRQLGDQEINIVDIVHPITKYAVMLRDPRQIRYHLDKAIYLALHGRPGPTWLDIPLDVQAAWIDENDLPAYDPGEDELHPNLALIEDQVSQVISRLKKAQRPVILAGNGIRLSGAVEGFHKLVDRLNIPVLTSINGHDLIWSDHPLFFGRPGIVGDRVGNLVQQNSDFLLSIGARLSVRQISYNYDSFARAAYRVMVDIDQAELKKPTISIHLPIHSDAGYFIEAMSRQLADEPLPDRGQWLGWCRSQAATLPTIFDDNPGNPAYVNSYRFVSELFQQLQPGSLVVTGNGTAYTGTFQAMSLKKGVRVFTNQGCASMGYDLPAAIGACFARDKQPVVLITGDGSIQMNIQELQTIVHHQLPIKIFMLHNDGYLAIRITQDSYFDGRHIGSEASGGLSLPNLCKIASAYGLESFEIHTEDYLTEGIQKALAYPGPILCQIDMDPHQTLFPKLSSVIKSDGSMISRPLEDMYPFLSRDEFLRHMIIPPLES